MVGLFDSFQSTSFINGLCSVDFFTACLFYLCGIMAINLDSKPTGSEKSENTFYLLIPSTLTFFISPNVWSAGGMEVLFLVFFGQILFSKAISLEQ